MTQVIEDSQGILGAVDEQIIVDADYQVRRHTICKAVCPHALPELDEGVMADAMRAYEIALVDMWDAAQDAGQQNKNAKEFIHICKKCVDIMQTVPVPKSVVSGRMHILKLISYACLGDRWGGIMRYLDENNEAWSMPRRDDAGWNHRVLAGVCQAVVYLVKKESLDGLARVGDTIRGLREDQKEYEEKYLDNADSGRVVAAADELAALYHLAKAVEQVGIFIMQGTPTDAQEQVDFHIRHAQTHAQSSGHIEIDIVLFVLHAALKKMMHNSIWNFARALPNLEEFIRGLVRAERPVFDLMYPQRTALNDGLLDPAKMAVVVNLPTSSGKTLIAEFRILQALGTAEGARVAYVVPTKTLVNQISARLRMDLGEKFNIAKMSGASEIGEFEEEIVRQNNFDILVTTPEKLQLLVRSPNREFAKSLVLTIVDEAHNMADATRGFNLEMLLATIKHDCANSHFLLMSPSIPNGNDLARWLDPVKSKSISMEVDWTPNDRVIGTYYYRGTKRNISTYFRPLIDGTQNDIGIKEITIRQVSDAPYTASSMPHYKMTALLATQLDRSQNLLVLATSIADTWKIADEIVQIISDSKQEVAPQVNLVIRYVSQEMGPDFPLNEYLRMGLAVHHAGLPDDVRSLVEWLAERGHVRVLVATSTISEGTNFPVSGMLINSYMHFNEKTGRSEPMPAGDFWNLVRRVGRVNQPAVGMVGIASDEGNVDKVESYVKTVVGGLVSHLEKMIIDARKKNKDLNLPCLASDPNWSRFLQYIAHIKNQSDSMDHFEMRMNSTLDKTYGYGRIGSDAQQALRDAVHRYAQKLDKRPAISRLSDTTGFAPENVASAIRRIREWPEEMRPEDWAAENLFSAQQTRMQGLIALIAETIPETRDVGEWMRKNGKSEKEVSMLVADWVSGASIERIAARHFGGSGVERIVECVKVINKIICHGITWGVAGIQKMPDSGAERAGASSIPAMVHYGVNTKEAVLMCMNGVPRRMAARIGKMYGQSTPSDIMAWLDELSDDAWGEKENYGFMSGADNKMVWRILTGRAHSI